MKTRLPRFLRFLSPLCLAVWAVAPQCSAQAADCAYATNNDGTITITGSRSSDAVVSIPDAITGLPVTRIGEEAFSYCDNLISVTIADSVTSIGDYAFIACTSLIGVRFQGDAPSLGVDVFRGTPATVYYLPGTAGWGPTFGGRPTIRVGPPDLEVHLCAALSITGAVGTVYSVEYITDLEQTNNPSAWWCLEYLQLPASPYLWADKSAPATDKRFYRAVAMEAPQNMVFIPPGTFRMGSPTNEVDRYEWEGPQTAVTISRGYWMGKYEVTQGEYEAVMGNNTGAMGSHLYS